MKGNQMRRNHLLKYTALLFLAGGLLAATPVSSFANSDVGKGASKKYMQSGSEQNSTEQNGSGQNVSEQNGTNWQDTQLAGSGEGTDPGIAASGTGVKEVAGGAYAFHDQDAPAATRAYGYTREEAQALCDYLYGVKTDPVKREIAESVLMNLDGLEFFPNPTVMFLQDGTGKVIVAVETGDRFTEEQAAANYATVRGLVPVIEQLKAATAQKDDSDTAKYISDYIAGLLEYDTSFSKNSLGDALRYGVTACVGYNSLSELLFEHCGLPYISIVADEKGSDASHIFGVSKIQNSWLVFDTTNYDREGGNEPFWIFSDKYREGQFYSNFRMVETPDGFRPEA